MDYGGSRKRGRNDNGNGGFKKSKQEMESFSTGIGSKSKPCTKFFSTSGCAFGDGCHFSHYLPGGFKAASHMLNISTNQPSRSSGLAPSSSPLANKSRLCTKFNSAEGCKFGDKCHYSHDDPRSIGPIPRSSFGASATAKISIDASLVGPIIGKNGLNSKQISRLTGAKLSIRDHEMDPNLKNIELQGSFDQIDQASAMVQVLIGNLRPGPGPPMQHSSGRGFGASSFKTKICERFAKGSCTFGDRCHFAHGTEELRSSVM